MEIDLSKEGLQNLLAVINAKAVGYTLGETDVVFTNPVAWSSVDFPKLNTEITMSATDTGIFKGSYTFQYRRVPLESLGRDVQLVVDDSVTLSGILTAVSMAMRIVQSEVVLDAEVVPPIPLMGSVVVRLNAKPNSLLYTGSVNIVLNDDIPAGARLLEDDVVRQLEDNSIRFIESA